MPGPPSGDGDGRLHRCIRDLAALNALPSMCVGRSLEEALDIVLDALPTALSCDLIHLRLPGSLPQRASLRGVPVAEVALAELSASFAVGADGSGSSVVPGLGNAWYLE